MDELETENPDEVRLLAELFDLKSADDMHNKIRELTDAEAAIDQLMNTQNEQANENAPTEGRGAVVDVDTEGVFDNAEQSDNRGQQNGNDALGTGGADLIYEAGTQRSGMDAGDESRQRFDRVQNYAVKEEVTPAQLGVTNGSTTQRVQVLDESAFEPGSPEAMAIQSAREAGLDPVIIRGAMDIGGKQARAFISGNRVILQADARVSADKLLKHERYHRDAKRNPKLNTMIRQALVNNMTEQELGDLVSRYITAYDGVYDFSQMTQEEIERICEEELFADLYAGIDNTERTDLREAVQQGYSEAQATEQNTEAEQGATGMLEGRASREDGRWPFVDNDTNDFMFRKGNNFVSRTEAIQAEARKAAEMAADGSVRSPFADGFEQEIRNDKTPLDDIEIKPTKKLKGAKENTIRDTIRSDDQIYKGDAENKDSGLTISIGNFGTSDTGTYAVRSHNMDRGVALSGIKELVEEAKIIGTSNTEIDPTQKLKGRNNPQRMFQYIFAAPYRFVNEDGTKSDRKIAILRVDAMYDTEEGAIHRFYNLNSVDVINSGASSNDANPASETRAKLNSAPNVSISDILQIVNPNLVGNHVTVAQPGMFSVDIGGESYDELVNRAQTVQRDLESARQQLRDVENSDEYKAWVERLTSDLNDQTIAEYKQWEDANGLTELNERLDSLKKEWNDLSKRVNAAVKERQANAVKKAADKSGLSEADYNRRQAVNEFGYTTDFEEAGYILPNGKMLNFSGEKGRHNGQRGQDHRAIGTIYPDDITGSAAMLKFMGEGYIRIMAESPGIDIAEGQEPTAQQYSAITKFVNESDGRGFFNVDFTDESGRTVANLVYNGKVTAAKVKADIQHYFRTGEIRRQSSLAQFRYSVEVPGDIRRQLADAEREYMEHSDTNDAEYDYRAQLEKINDLRRQIEEAESVNAEADNINAETDTNPTIEALEREGRVSRGTYDVEKYGDTHPERGEVGRDGVRMCNTTADLEAELNEIGGAKIRNDAGEYFARIRRKNDNGYLLTINRNGKRDTSRSFGNIREASAYAASYIEGQTQARTDAELDNEKSAPVPRQEPIEALTTGQVQDEAKRQKQNKAAEASTQSLRDKIRKTDEEIKALRRLEKTTGLTETQAKHKKPESPESSGPPVLSVRSDIVRAEIYFRYPCTAL